MKRSLLIGTWVFVVLWASARLLAEEVAEKSLANWPQWRGPTFTGVTPVGDPPVRWSATENLQWKAPIEGRGHSMYTTYDKQQRQSGAVQLRTRRISRRSAR